jgi:hypothetical protein
MTDWNEYKMEPKRNGNNKSLDGGRYLGVGEHEVAIDGIELGAYENGGMYVDISYSNEDGQSTTDRLSPLWEGEYTYKYNSLAWALCPEDGVVRFKYFLSMQSHLCTNPQGWGALVGLSVGIVIAPEKKGAIINEDNGVFTLVDNATGEACVMPDGSDNSYTSFKEASQKAKDNGIKRAYNKVQRFTAPQDVEKATSNQTVLTSVLKG